MARRAVWRARKDDPKGAFGWLLRALPRGRLPLLVAFLLTSLVGALALGWSAWTVLLLPFVAAQVRRPLPRGDLAALATVPSPGPAFACRVEVRRGDVLLGEDVGVLTFVKGWLYFMGERTDFSLRRADARSSRHDTGLSPWGSLLLRHFVESRTWGLRLRGPNVTLALFSDESVRFEPLAAWDATEMFEEPDAVRTGFVRSFGYWFHTEDSAQGESLWPPNAMHPTGMARAWRSFAGALALLFSLLFVLDLIWPHSGGVFAGLCSGVLMPAFKRLGEARRLARGAKRAISADRRVLPPNRGG